MYRRILVTLEHTRTDRAILTHVRGLARAVGARLLLIHVADGVMARNLKALDYRESDEMRRDRAYLDAEVAALVAEGFDAEAVLAAGDPGAEICACAEREGCDLIAMATHGHRGLNDLLRGSVANDVRHRTTIPVLMVLDRPAP